MNQKGKTSPREPRALEEVFKTLLTLVLVCISSVSLANEGQKGLVSKLNYPFVSADDSPTPFGIIRLLRQEGLLPDCLFDADGLTPKAEAIQVSEVILKVDGYLEPYGKIYNVSFNLAFFNSSVHSEENSFRQVFVIKYFTSADVKEIKKLTQVQESPLSKLPMQDRSFPVMSLYEKIFFYKTKEKLHSLILLHSARGKMVETFFKEVLSNQKDIAQQEQNALEHLRLARRAFYRTGQAAAKLHLRFRADSNKESQKLLTQVHGDYHSGNIFFDSKSDRIYFIDNETMAESLDRPQYFGKDIEDFIKNLAYSETDENRSLVTSLYNDFVEGYLSKVPESMRSQIKTEIETIFKDIRSNRTSTMTLRHHTQALYK